MHAESFLAWPLTACSRLQGASLRRVGQGAPPNENVVSEGLGRNCTRGREPRKIREARDGPVGREEECDLGL